MYILYADDSGNTGTDYENKDQPIFSLAGWIINTDNWTELNDFINEKKKEIMPEYFDVEIHTTDIFNGKKDKNGTFDFRKEINIYGERAHKLKEIFCRHKFYIVYDKDLDEDIADGFYFTIGYHGMTSGELAHALMYYGVSAICLITTGSHQEGLRVCTSFIKDNQYDLLEERMKIFEENN